MSRFLRCYHAFGALKQELKPEYPFKLLNLKIGKLKHVSIHPNAETMYVSEVDLGNGSKKQICSGIRKLIPVEALIGQLCVVVDNMKKCKLRGEISEAMLLCGEHETNGQLHVELCQPVMVCSENHDLLIGKQVKVNVSDEISTRKIKSKEWDDISSRIFVGDNGIVVYEDSGKELPLFVEANDKRVNVSVQSLPRGSKVK